MSFVEKMLSSIGENYYIFINAAVALVFMFLSFIIANQTKKHFSTSTGPLKTSVYYTLDISYTLFITLISIFPLLGMFGTVKALLDLDMSAETSALQNNFFSALTSTAWGIIFAVAFKVLNSFVQPFIENQIAKAKEEIKKQIESK